MGRRVGMSVLERLLLIIEKRDTRTGTIMHLFGVSCRLDLFFLIFLND